MLAALNWLSAFMAIACLLPVVFSAMLALKPAALGDHLETAAGAAALDVAADIAAGLAPGAGDFAALGDDGGLQVELVGVAGAGEAPSPCWARRPYRSRGSGCARWSRRRASRCRRRTRCRPCRRRRSTGRSRSDAAKPVMKNATAANVSRRAWANSFEVWTWLTDGTLPIDRYMRHQLKRHSISPIRSCH